VQPAPIYTPGAAYAPVYTTPVAGRPFGGISPSTAAIGVGAAGLIGGMALGAALEESHHHRHHYGFGGGPFGFGGERVVIEDRPGLFGSERIIDDYRPGFFGSEEVITDVREDMFGNTEIRREIVDRDMFGNVDGFREEIIDRDMFGGW